MQERCLGAIRLSVLTDATTSPERQAEHIERAAAQRGGVVVHLATDLGVSASNIPPMDRPALSVWFTDKKNEWDTLIVWRLDRLVRKVGDLAELIRWCDANGKNIVSATEPFDLSTPLGKALVYLVAVFAELEAIAIRERVTGAHQALRTTGRWGGGVPIFGTKPVPNPDGNGWVLDIEPTTHLLLKELVDRVVAGEAMNSITHDFNSRKVLSPRDFGRVANGLEPLGTSWSVSSLSGMLRSETLRGFVVHDKKLVRDSNGMPVRVGPEQLTQQRFDELQAALDRRTFKAPKTGDVSPLLDVAFCALCASPLYRHRTRRGEKTYTYYKCPNRNLRRTCDGGNVRADDLEQTIEESLLSRIGDIEVMRPVRVRGTDRTSELEDVERSLSDLREDRAAGLFTGERGTHEFRDLYRKLELRREELSTHAVTPDRTEYVSTGKTWTQTWAVSTEQERRALLLDSGITAKVANTDYFAVDVHIPADILERVTRSTALQPSS
jgi:DNA invertase Pin-like site-specific DNA recombinase